MRENKLEILNTGSYDPFLWCLDVRERALALKSRLKRRQLTAYGLNLITGLALTIYRFFYEFTDFSKITERKNQNINFQELQLWLNEDAQNK
jgi:hypothetical protein